MTRRARSNSSIRRAAGRGTVCKNQFEWIEKVLLPQLANKGITEKKQEIDAIGCIFSNRTGVAS